MLVDSVITSGEPFDLERCCDNLMINGVDVEMKDNVPETLDAGAMINWSSDFSVTQLGWQLCFSEVPEPTDAPGFRCFQNR